MPQSAHDRTAELHNLAEHAHAAAAVAHGKGDHMTAHELSKQALEHSMNAYKHSEELSQEAHAAAKA
jgi:fructose-1,6-bisphosphatase/sedoheptulose 1,7-bisphosphatase-like protein